MFEDRLHQVTVTMHTYGYWRSQCTCGVIQNWRFKEDAEWWRDRHEEIANADR